VFEEHDPVVSSVSVGPDEKLDLSLFGFVQTATQVAWLAVTRAWWCSILRAGDYQALLMNSPPVEIAGVPRATSVSLSTVWSPA